jgi:calcineurin-like phosphoesterase
VFMLTIDDPFQIVLREIEAMRTKTKLIVVDFHAEATSEKIAMGWHLDGKVTLVVGTHTHVQTADERILPNGHGLFDRCRHDRPPRFDHRYGTRTRLARFLNGMPSRFEPATGNPRLNGVIVDADDKTGRALAIRRISYSEQELTQLEAGAARDLHASTPRS